MEGKYTEIYERIFSPEKKEEIGSAFFSKWRKNTESIIFLILFENETLRFKDSLSLK